MVSADGKFDLLNPTLRNPLYTNKYIIMFTEYFQLLWELLNLKCGIVKKYTLRARLTKQGKLA